MKSEIRGILESTTKKLFSTEIKAFDVSRTKLKTHGALELIMLLQNANIN